MSDDDDCLCRPCGFLLGLPFMLLSAILSLIGIVVWVIATLLICICPCGVCLAAIISFAIWTYAAFAMLVFTLHCKL